MKNKKWIILAIVLVIIIAFFVWKQRKAKQEKLSLSKPTTEETKNDKK